MAGTRLHLFVLLVGLTAPLARATWFGENVADGAEIMMMDLRYPWWGESTYNAHWNFAPNSPQNFSGYGGFTMGVESLAPDHMPNYDPDVQAAYRPGSVWSFWGSNAEGEPVRVVETSEFCFPRQYVGEGASGSLGGHWPFVTLGRWYTVMMRVWEPLDPGAEGMSYIGRWVKDVEADRWYLYGIVRIPAPASSFKGNAGFLEDFGNGGRSVRALHRRRGYYYKEGAWHTSATVTYNVPAEGGGLNTYWVVNRIENNEVLAMELSSNRALLPQKLQGDALTLGETHSFTVDQAALPSLDQPAIDKVKALSNGHQVLVTWEIPASGSPQFQYKVEVFGNPRCEGDPVAVCAARMPTTRAVLLAAAAPAPTVRVSMTDVFNQVAEPVVVNAGAASAPAEAAVGETAPGLAYEFLVQDAERHVNVMYPPCEKADFSRNETHFWVSLQDVGSARLTQLGICRGFDTELRGARANGYAFRFRGYLRVPASGLYLFHMAGTDGYTIGVNGREALTWDGLHGPERKTFALSLSAGDHRLSVDYFVDKSEPFFELEWEGPGLPRQEIPHAALLHEVTTPMPNVIVSADGGTDGRVSITVLVEPRAHTINRTQLFLDTMQIAEAESASLNYSGLLPGGDHRLWARVFHDGNHTLDSDALALTVGTKAPVGWELGVAGEAEALRNVLQTAPDAFSFVGEGEYTVFRPVTGDFTLTCRLDECLGLNGEPVNGSSWAGLTVREFPDRNNYRWGGEFGIMQTAHHGLRTTPDWSDGGASRLCVQVLPENQPWLRLIRRGALWTAWTSTDGRQWTYATTHYKRLNLDVGAGIVFRALPQDAQMYFRARISQISLVEGTVADSAIPMPATARETAAADLTGVVVAPSDPRTIVARSPTRGLLRSEDGGTTWTPANGLLDGPANAVRGVAIHPMNPAIMLRAAGRAGNDGSFEGGLYRTTDGGATWETLAFPGDFDGAGPAALCGDVIAYGPNDPDVVVVGCETRGVFRSENGGTTWREVLPGGDRITALKAHPWHFPNGDGFFVHAVTCSDTQMVLLGRGVPVLAANPHISRDYVSHDGGKTFGVQSERTDVGYLNIGFSDFMLGTFLYGTTQGLLNTFSDGRETYLIPNRVAMESGRPITALGVSLVSSQTWPRVYAQALTPQVPGRVSRCDYSRDNRWAWQEHTGPAPAGLIAIVAGDQTAESTGTRWWFLGLDGLYRTSDSAATLTKVLE